MVLRARLPELSGSAVPSAGERHVARGSTADTQTVSYPFFREDWLSVMRGTWAALVTLVYRQVYFQLAS